MNVTNPKWRAAISLVITLASLSAGKNLIAQQTTPPPQPQVVDTPVPPPVTLPGAPVQAADVPNRPLTADEAARIALRLQPSITVARAGILTAQGVTQQSRSGLLPFVSSGFGYTNVQRLSGAATSAAASTGGSGSTSGFTGSVTLQQLIYDFDHTRDLVRQNQALEWAAIQNLSVAQQEVVFQVKQAFYQYVEYGQLVTVNNENVRNRQDQLTLANARLKAGLGLASDVVTAQTAVSEAVQNLTVTRNNAETARVNLALQMGIDPRTPIDPAPSAEPMTASNDVNGFVRTALQQRPEILQAQATIEAYGHAVSAARTYNAPVLLGSVGVGTRGDQFFPGNDTYSVSASLQFPLYDGGQTAGRVKEARGNLESAQAQLRSAQLAVSSDVSHAYLNLRSAEQRVAAAVSEVANAREGIRIATGRYRAGLGQFLDILNAQQFLFTAEQDQAAAQYAAEQAGAALTRATGVPPPTGPQRRF